MPEQPRLTNIFSKIHQDKGKNEESLLVIEATCLFPFQLSRPERRLIQLWAEAKINMYDGILNVMDGVIKEVAIDRQAGGVVFRIYLETETEVVITTQDGLPARTTLHFSREPLKLFYQGKSIVIDPGHGGRDGGYRGPVNLWEKDVVWTTAQELLQGWQRLKVKAILTRTATDNPSWQERLNKVDGATDLFVGIHTHGATGRKERGAAVLYNPRARDSVSFGCLVLERIAAKTKIPGRYARPCPELAALGDKQALILETSTITSWVDEGILRNPHFHREVAVAMIVGFYQFQNKGGL